MPSRQPSPPDAAMWQRLRPLLDELLGTPLDARREAIERAGLTAAEQSLVLELLGDAEDDTPDRFEHPPLEVPTDGWAALPGSAQAGDRVGPWELRRRLGEGGMGEVWSVARTGGSFTQRGALKRLRDVPRQDAEGAEILARFERERQVLASLEDPSISRLIDGGVDDEGRPYLVMEYVEGEPIDVWCNARRLPMRDRVDLLARVARAVDVAHAHRIVHRDLKPSNVLIDGEGRPRLIDFGVAKVLEQERDTPLVTRDVTRYLTPLFASPEQFTGAPPTTASDVYSLGALAYWVLTSRPPLELAGLGATEAVRQVTSDDPQPPSTALVGAVRADAHVSAERGASSKQLTRTLTGDLDTVILRCLRKEPARRYGRAHELADDLQRWLDGAPVFARRDTAGYRTRRFVKRNWTVVVLTGVAFLLLVAGLSIALMQRAKLTRQSDELARKTARSEKLLEDLRVSIGGLTTMHYQDLAAIPGTEQVMARLTRSLGAIASAQDDMELMIEAVRAYWLNGVNVWSPFQPNAGRPRDAAKSIHRARELGLALVERPDASLRAYSVTAEVVARSCWSLVYAGELEAALDQTHADEAWLRSLMDRTPEEILGPNQSLLAEAEQDASFDRIVLAWCAVRSCRNSTLLKLGRRRDALATLKETRDVIARTTFKDPINASMLADERREAARCIRAQERHLGLATSAPLTSASNPPSHARMTQLAVDRAAAMGSRVTELLHDGDVDEARQLVLREMTWLDEPSASEQPVNARPSSERAKVRHMLATIELEAGHVAIAQRHARLALDELQRCVQGRPIAWIEEYELRELKLTCGRATAAAGDAVEGARLLGSVLDQADRRLTEFPADWFARLDAVDACCALARLQEDDRERRRWLDRADMRLGDGWTDAPEAPGVRDRRSQIELLR